MFGGLEFKVVVVGRQLVGEVELVLQREPRWREWRRCGWQAEVIEDPPENGRIGLVTVVVQNERPTVTYAK